MMIAFSEINVDVIFAILSLLSEADSCPNQYYRVSDKSPLCGFLSELIYLKLKIYGWRQVNHGNRL